MDTQSTERDRIEQLMIAEGLNSVQFANETGIKGATLSHILNGRNNPSLDVMKRILERYRNVSSDWFLFGAGQMYRQKSQPQALSLFEESMESVNKSIDYPRKKTSENLSVKKDIRENKETLNGELQNLTQSIPSEHKVVNKIIVYYSDNTFEEFKAQQ